MLASAAACRSATALRVRRVRRGQQSSKRHRARAARSTSTPIRRPCGSRAVRRAHRRLQAATKNNTRSPSARRLVRTEHTFCSSQTCAAPTLARAAVHALRRAAAGSHSSSEASANWHGAVLKEPSCARQALGWAFKAVEQLQLQLTHAQTLSRRRVACRAALPLAPTRPWPHSISAPCPAVAVNSRTSSRARAADGAAEASRRCAPSALDWYLHGVRTLDWALYAFV